MRKFLTGFLSMPQEVEQLIYDSSSTPARVNFIVALANWQFIGNHVRNFLFLCYKKYRTRVIVRMIGKLYNE